MNYIYRLDKNIEDVRKVANLVANQSAREPSPQSEKVVQHRRSPFDVSLPIELDSPFSDPLKDHVRKVANLVASLSAREPSPQSEKVVQHRRPPLMFNSL